MEKIRIKKLKNDLYGIIIHTGTPTNYYINKRIEISGEIYRIIKIVESEESHGQRLHKLIAYKRPVETKNYNNLNLTHIISIERENPTTNLIVYANKNEIRYTFSNSKEALTEFIKLQRIRDEEMTSPWIKLI